MRREKIISSKNKQQLRKGFTIIELMVSTVVFTMILVGVSVALVQVSRTYYRGITISRTQETLRNVSDEITQSIQFSGSDIQAPNYGPVGAPVTAGPDIPGTSTGNGNDTFFFCIGPKRYTFAIDRKLTPNPVNGKEFKHVLWVDIPASGCANASPAATAQTNINNADEPTVGGQELLEENMRITKLELIPSGNGLWTLNLALAYGEDDLLVVSSGRKTCEGSRVGIELCATAEFSSTVLKRVQ